VELTELLGKKILNINRRTIEELKIKFHERVGKNVKTSPLLSQQI